MLIPNPNLGKNIAYHRKRLKLTQAKLAAIVGMQENHLYKIETGRYTPSIITLVLIAGGLGGFD